MQSLIRSKSAGVTGGRGTAGAGPGRDLLYLFVTGATPGGTMVRLSTTECTYLPTYLLPLHPMTNQMEFMYPCLLIGEASIAASLQKVAE